MMSFKKFVSEEENKGIILHLPHLEDLIIDKGTDGINEFIAIVNDVLNNKNTSFSTKYDGSPAIYFGIDPSDDKFFVTTKSINNTEPKLLKEYIDIHKFSHSVGIILWQALEALSQLQLEKNIVYHGDMLYVPSDLFNFRLKDIDYLAFTPNTLSYAVEYDENSKIYNSTFGIVVHTKYICKKDGQKFILNRTVPDFNDIVKQTEDIEDLFILSPIIKKDINFVRKNDIKKELEKIKRLFTDLSNDIFLQIDNIPNFKNRLKVFINSQLDMNDCGIFGSVCFDFENFIKQMTESFDMWFDKQIEQLKSQNGKKAKLETKVAWNVFLSDNVISLQRIFEIYHIMIRIKNLILTELNNNNDQPLQTFIKVKDRNKYRRTSGEGFVLTTSHNTVKIVDRVEFSRLNRLFSANRKTEK